MNGFFGKAAFRFGHASKKVIRGKMPLIHISSNSRREIAPPDYRARPRLCVRDNAIAVFVGTFFPVNVNALPGYHALAHNGPESGLEISELIGHARRKGAVGAGFDAGHAVPAVARIAAIGFSGGDIHSHQVAGTDLLAAGLFPGGAAGTFMHIDNRGHGFVSFIFFSWGNFTLKLP
jgi:hypothetical protein